MSESRGRDGGSPRSRSRSRARSKSRVSARFKNLLAAGRSKSKKKDLDSPSTADSALSTAVSVHDLSKTSETNKTTEPPKEVKAKEVASLQLVLLLMDPATRRFELLQLEFDSAKARVSDIISQIPVSVTEAAIKQQKYDGVLDEAGKKMGESTRLVDFCSGKKVLVALPQGISIRECNRLARPILSDSQVVKMLSGSGFDVKGWEKKEEMRTRAVPQKSALVNRSEPIKPRKSSSAFPAIAVLALVVIVLQIVHNFIAAPIQPGVPLAPGTWRSKCGVLTYLPSAISQCSNSYLEVNDDGTVTVSGSDGELEMLVVGGVCKKDDCLPGIALGDDGNVSVGGRRVKTATVYGSDSSIAPWPFKEDPKMKVKTRRLNR